jgi:hypothetical protein
MTSLELVEFINSTRRPDEAELRHDHFTVRVPKVLGETAPKFLGIIEKPMPNGGTRTYAAYRFPKREACLMAMSYSYELQAKVFDRMTALETVSAPAVPANAVHQPPERASIANPDPSALSAVFSRPLMRGLDLNSRVRIHAHLF